MTKVMMSTKDFTWCETCRAWVETNSLETVRLNNITWKCCPACQDGICMTIDEVKHMDAGNKKEIAKAIWEL